MVEEKLLKSLDLSDSSEAVSEAADETVFLEEIGALGALYKRSRVS